MEKHYFLQRRTSLTIYHLDLFGFDPKKDYKEILDILIPRIYNEHPILALKLRISLYYLLLYCLSSATYFNKSSKDFRYLKEELFNSIPQYIVESVYAQLTSKYKVIGKSRVISKL